MASISFQERFKDRISAVSKNGELSLNPAAAVTKGQGVASKVQAQHLAPEEMPVKPRARSYHQPRLKAASSGPSLNHSILVEAPRPSGGRPPLVARHHSAVNTVGDARKRRDRSFTPYTINDYRLIRHDNYYQLGGLGAYNIGSEEWKKKREVSLKRTEYARNVVLQHSRRLGVSSEQRPRVHAPRREAPAPWGQPQPAHRGSEANRISRRKQKIYEWPGEPFPAK